MGLLGAALACGDGEATGVGAGASPDAVLPNGMTARQMVEARALHMKDLGGSFKSVKDQLNSSSPNLALVRVAAQEVQSASLDLPTWFPIGSGPETGLEMRAFKEVWSDPAGFAKSAKEFQTAASALQQVVQGSDLEAARSQMESVGKTCGTCHDTYRSKKD